MRDGEQSKQAVLAFFGFERRLPLGIARHPRKNRSGAEDEAVIAYLGGVGDRPRSRAPFKSLLERVTAKHPPLS